VGPLGLRHSVAATLGGLAAIHAAWAFTSWPLSDRARFAEVVAGASPDRAPSAVATLGVATLLAQSAVLVAQCHSCDRGRQVGGLSLYGTRTVACALLARATAGFVVSGGRLQPLPDSFRRLDLTVYSPLCLVLGTGAAVVASSASPAARRAGSRR